MDEKFELTTEQFMLVCRLVAVVLGDGYLEDEYNQMYNEGRDDELEHQPYALAVQFAETIKGVRDGL